VKTQFGKDEREAARAFIIDAEIVNQTSADTFRAVTYRKPDGSLWIEFDSKLEAPENVYSLELRK
jgi:hypothetical protein